MTVVVLPAPSFATTVMVFEPSFRVISFEKVEVFMNYLKEQFPGCIEDHFTYDLIKNLIDYVYREHGHTKNSARAIIASILPEVTHEELEAYLPDFDEWEAKL